MNVRDAAWNLCAIRENHDVTKTSPWRTPLGNLNTIPESCDITRNTSETMKPSRASKFVWDMTGFFTQLIIAAAA
jgi:hypothetical protein